MSLILFSLNLSASLNNQTEQIVKSANEETETVFPAGLNNMTLKSQDIGAAKKPYVVEIRPKQGERIIVYGVRLISPIVDPETTPMHSRTEIKNSDDSAMVVEYHSFHEYAAYATQVSQIESYGYIFDFKYSPKIELDGPKEYCRYTFTDEWKLKSFNVLFFSIRKNE